MLLEYNRGKQTTRNGYEIHRLKNTAQKYHKDKGRTGQRKSTSQDSNATDLS